MTDICTLANNIIELKYMVIILIGLGFLTWRKFNYYFGGATAIFGIATFIRWTICG